MLLLSLFVFISHSRPSYLNNNANGCYAPDTTFVPTTQSDCKNKGGTESCMWAMGVAPQGGSSTITVSFGGTSVSGANGDVDLSITGSDAEQSAFTISVANGQSNGGDNFLAVEGATFNDDVDSSCNGGDGQGGSRKINLGDDPSDVPMTLDDPPACGPHTLKVSWVVTQTGSYGGLVINSVTVTIVRAVQPPACSERPPTASPAVQPTRPPAPVIIRCADNQYGTLNSEINSHTWRIAICNDLVHVEMSGPTRDWVAFAFSNGEDMNGNGQLALVYSESEGDDCGALSAWDLGNYARGSEVSTRNIGCELTVENGQFTMYTTTPFIADGDFDFGSTFTMFTATSESGAGAFRFSGKHAEKSITRGLSEATVVDGGIRVKIVPSDAQNAHGALMFTAWGILVPIAVLSAVNKNNFSFFQDVKIRGLPLWWATHRTFNYLAVILTIVGFFIAIDMTEVDHFSFTHAKIGLTVFIFALFQPIIAFFRPHAPDKEKGETKSTARLAFEIVHTTIGVVTLYLGMGNCISGLDKLADFGGDTDGAKTGMFVWLIIVMVSWLISKVVWFACSGEEKKDIEMNTSGGTQLTN